MNISLRSLFGTGFMLAMLLAAFASFAQEPVEAEDGLMPAVDTSVTPQEEVPKTDVTRTTTEDQVMDSIELGRTEIKGNQELPKVLYIVPWKKADPGGLMGKPVNSLLDEVLAPLDREEFMRQVEYYDDLYGEEEE
jgi:hypothetical protein